MIPRIFRDLIGDLGPRRALGLAATVASLVLVLTVGAVLEGDPWYTLLVPMILPFSALAFGVYMIVSTKRQGRRIDMEEAGRKSSRDRAYQDWRP